MRLLITTQAVDKHDPVLGFFHRWLEEFAKHCEHIHVICLKEGRHDLPKNVSVHSLGKESGRSRVKYIRRFYRHIIALCGEYDAVFVHMNEEYVLLGGIFWRLWGKRIVLWRNHKKGSLFTRFAALLAHTVCYTSPQAFVARFRNAVQMPIGIDTGLFKPAGEAEPRSLLFLGRLDPVKNPDIFLAALKRLKREGVEFHADVYGDPTDPAAPHAAAFRNEAAPLVAVEVLALHPGVPNDETPAIYARHSIYANLTPSGSFDKTIGEAMASGCIAVIANDALRGIVPDELLVDACSADSVANGIKAALAMDEGSRSALAERLRGYVLKNHSLTLLSSRLMELYGNRV